MIDKSGSDKLELWIGVETDNGDVFGLYITEHLGTTGGLIITSGLGNTGCVGSTIDDGVGTTNGVVGSTDGWGSSMLICVSLVKSEEFEIFLYSFIHFVLFIYLQTIIIFKFTIRVALKLTNM